MMIIENTEKINDCETLFRRLEQFSNGDQCFYRGHRTHFLPQRFLPYSYRKIGDLSSKNIKKADDLLIKNIKRVMKANNAEDEEWFEFLCNEQHDTGKTVMLDVTSDPFVSAFFACCDYGNYNEKLESIKDDRRIFRIRKIKNGIPVFSDISCIKENKIDESFSFIRSGKFQKPMYYGDKGENHHSINQNLSTQDSAFIWGNIEQLKNLEVTEIIINKDIITDVLERLNKMGTSHNLLYLGNRDVFYNSDVKSVDVQKIDEEISKIIEKIENSFETGNIGLLFIQDEIINVDVYYKNIQNKQLELKQRIFKMADEESASILSLHIQKTCLECVTLSHAIEKYDDMIFCYKLHEEIDKLLDKYAVNVAISPGILNSIKVSTKPYLISVNEVMGDYYYKIKYLTAANKFFCKAIDACKMGNETTYYRKARLGHYITLLNIGYYSKMNGYSYESKLFDDSNTLKMIEDNMTGFFADKNEWALISPNNYKKFCVLKNRPSFKLIE